MATMHRGFAVIMAAGAIIVVNHRLSQPKLHVSNTKSYLYTPDL
jgi:hypothetical protein